MFSQKNSGLAPAISSHLRRKPATIGIKFGPKTLTGQSIMNISLVVFTSVVFLFLAFAFAMSYLFWADKAKTPEVIAAEVMQFSEQLGSLLSIGAIGTVAFVLMWLFLRSQLAI